MKRKILIAVGALLVVVAAAHWYFMDRGRFTTEPVTTGLERRAVGNDLVSDRDPAATLRFDSAFRHLGVTRIGLVSPYIESVSTPILRAFAAGGVRGLNPPRRPSGPVSFRCP